MNRWYWLTKTLHGRVLSIVFLCGSLSQSIYILLIAILKNKTAWFNIFVFAGYIVILLPLLLIVGFRNWRMWTAKTLLENES
jgi:hypothetical protein